MNLAFSHEFLLGLECPHPLIDEVIFLRGVAQPPTRGVLAWVLLGVHHSEHIYGKPCGVNYQMLPWNVVIVQLFQNCSRCYHVYRELAPVVIFQMLPWNGVNSSRVGWWIQRWSITMVDGWWVDHDHPWRLDYGKEMWQVVGTGIDWWGRWHLLSRCFFFCFFWVGKNWGWSPTNINGFYGWLIIWLVDGNWRFPFRHDGVPPVIIHL